MAKKIVVKFDDNELRIAIRALDMLSRDYNIKRQCQEKADNVYDSAQYITYKACGEAYSEVSSVGTMLLGALNDATYPK